MFIGRPGRPAAFNRPLPDQSKVLDGPGGGLRLGAGDRKQDRNEGEKNSSHGRPLATVCDNCRSYQCTTLLSKTTELGSRIVAAGGGTGRRQDSMEGRARRAHRIGRWAMLSILAAMSERKRARARGQCGGGGAAAAADQKV